MSQSLLLAHRRPGFAPAIRRRAGILLAAGLLELGLWLFSALRDFYAGSSSIVLQVQPSLAFSQAHQLRSHFVATSAGGYFAGVKGELLYHASSLGDYFLFYSIGGITSLDALFFASLGCYLYRALRQPTGGRPAQVAGQVMEVSGGAASSMFLLKMALAAAANEFLWAKTDHLFRLASLSSTGDLYYVFLGSLLLLCGALLQSGALLPSSEQPVSG